MSETTTTASTAVNDDLLTSIRIRDLVDAYPDTMAILAPLGIDLCCGGGHALGEALTLHGIDQDTVLPQVAAVIQASPDDRG